MDSVVWREWKNFIDFLAMCFVSILILIQFRFKVDIFTRARLIKWDDDPVFQDALIIFSSWSNLAIWGIDDAPKHQDIQRGISTYLNGELIFEPRWKREFIPLGEENLTGHVSGHWLPYPPKTSFPKLFHQLSSKFDFDHVWHPLGLSLFVFVFHNLSLSKIQSVFCFAQFSFTAKCCEFQFWRKSTQQFRLKFPYSVNQSI